ncbi:hypothetical protein [Nocardioides alcanivorans]|uniref:hypothetical protein n=1 Tax=Nocardioides alcanivorans TaxID=2897352 RepID=UPI001F237547|nr:hypothetical protein [Nocardioides alcanivorans]
MGTLAGSHVEVEAPTERRVDDALVADMVDALVERALVTEMLSTESAGDAWILRPGTPRDDVEDRRWLREVERAATARNLPIPRLWVITKSGGTDVRASRTLTWVRARTS